ncbi:MAG: hypothetical protein LBV02_02705 [Bacteroidales bacterium]|jgi:hypothetical protein|nr:hypothetical protein [Bacteroidales bacterium]
MKIRDIVGVIVHHKFSAFIMIVCITYSAYYFWERGYFSITQTQKIAALVRGMMYFEGFKSDVPLPGWNPDRTIIPRAETFGDAAVPYIAEEIWSSKNPLQRKAGIFILTNAIRTKYSLSVIAETCRRGFGEPSVYEDAIGPSGLEYRFPVGSKLIISEAERTRNYRRLRFYRWYNRYNSRIVDTDYGIGLVMPDNTIRPLGYHGMRNERYTSSKNANKQHTDYFFCTKRLFKYSDNNTNVTHELSSLLYYTDPNQWEEEKRNGKLEQTERNMFFQLFSERVQSDPTFWPYYPVMRYTIVQGYFDSKHRQHGLWRDVDDESKIVTSERWFFHGEELTEDEYYSRGGSDMAISLSWDEENMDVDKMQEQ